MSSLKVTPATVELKAGESQAFDASQDGQPVPGVTWSLVDKEWGILDKERGVYRAPRWIFTARRVTIIAERTNGGPSAGGRGSAVIELDPVRDWIPFLGIYWIVVLAGLMLTMGLGWSWLCPSCGDPGLLVSPPLLTLAGGQAHQFVANADVTWTNTTTPSGLYVAPATSLEDQTVTVTATSVREARRSGSALVRLSGGGSFSIQPEAATVKPGGKVRLLPSLTGSDGTAIEWLQPSLGTVGPDGVYSAPPDAPPTTVTVLARARAAPALGGAQPRSLLAGAHVTVASSKANACECPGDCLAPWRLIALVALMGALGGLVHGVSSFGTYVGNRELRTSWLWWYYLKPVLASIVAVLVFLVFRAGLGTPDIGISAWDCLKVAGLAGLVGLFAEPATLKLRDVFEAFFTPRQDPRTDRAGQARTPSDGPVITKIEPATFKSGEGTELRISGRGFAKNCAVKIGTTPFAKPEWRSATELKVKVAAGEVPKGPQDVVVFNAPPAGEASNTEKVTVQ